MYDDMFRKTEGVESVVFLLTEMNDGNVKAEPIRNPGDRRLVKPAKAFALIQVDHFRLSEDELQVLGDVDSYIDGVGCCRMLKPRVYNRLTEHGNNDFFAALSCISDDVILSDQLVNDGEWRVVPSTQKNVSA